MVYHSLTPLCARSQVTRQAEAALVAYSNYQLITRRRMPIVLIMVSKLEGEACMHPISAIVGGHLWVTPIIFDPRKNKSTQIWCS